MTDHPYWVGQRIIAAQIAFGWDLSFARQYVFKLYGKGNDLIPREVYWWVVDNCPDVVVPDACPPRWERQIHND